MTLEVRKFIARIEEKDMARSNLYLVVFPSMKEFGADEQQDDKFGIGDAINAVSSIRSVYKSTKRHGIKGILNGDTFDTVSGLFGADYKIEQNLGMMAKAVSLPGSTFEVDVDKTRRKPYHVIKSKTDDSVTMSFYLTANHPERKALMAWFRTIYDSDTQQVAFHSSYARTIEIFTYNRNDERATVTTLVNAFPTRMGSVSLGYENSNTISEFEVEFVYEKCAYTNVTDTGGDVFDTIGKTFKKAKGLLGSAKGALNLLGF